MKFKVCSSDSSSSSSEEEEGPTEDERENIKLEKFVKKATQRHQELKKGKQIEDGCQNENPDSVMNDELRKYKTLNWACTFIADRGCGEELKPDDLLQRRRRKKGSMKREKSSAECTSSDTDESSGEELEFDEEKLLVLQTKLERALEGVKVLSKRDRRRVRKAEEYDAFFTEGLSISDEEAANERDLGTDSSIGIPEVRGVNEILEENNNKEKYSSVSEAKNAMGESEKAEKDLSGEENKKNREGNLEQLKSQDREEVLDGEQLKSPGEEGVLDGVQLQSPRKEKGKKEKMSKISPLRKMFPQRFSMSWKRNPRFQVPRGKGE